MCDDDFLFVLILLISPSMSYGGRPVYIFRRKRRGTCSASRDDTTRDEPGLLDELLRKTRAKLAFGLHWLLPCRAGLLLLVSFSVSSFHEPIPPAGGFSLLCPAGFASSSHRVFLYLLLPFVCTGLKVLLDTPDVIIIILIMHVRLVGWLADRNGWMGGWMVG